MGEAISSWNAFTVPSPRIGAMNRRLHVVPALAGMVHPGRLQPELRTDGSWAALATSRQQQRTAVILLRRGVGQRDHLQVKQRARTIEEFQGRPDHPTVPAEFRPAVERELLIGRA